MPRPSKCKRICSLPENQLFYADNSNPACINLTVDEYECIRLIDYQDLTQEEVAKIMNVARTTVQAVYASARKKIAEFIINGTKLKIDGGNYRLCPHHQNCEKNCLNCHKCNKEKK